MKLINRKKFLNPNCLERYTYPLSGKDAFEVADKNGLQSSHHMSSHDSSRLSEGGFFRFPEVF